MWHLSSVVNSFNVIWLIDESLFSIGRRSFVRRRRSFVRSFVLFSSYPIDLVVVERRRTTSTCHWMWNTWSILTSPYRSYSSSRSDLTKKIFLVFCQCFTNQQRKKARSTMSNVKVILIHNTKLDRPLNFFHLTRLSIIRYHLSNQIVRRLMHQRHHWRRRAQRQQRRQLEHI